MLKGEIGRGRRSSLVGVCRGSVLGVSPSMCINID